MRLVFVASPCRGNWERNQRYARAAIADSLRLGEAPFQSCLMYAQPGVLDDTKPEERAHGMRAAVEWLRVVERLVVYGDLGISEGMQKEIDLARSIGLLVEIRTLAIWTEDC